MQMIEPSLNSSTIYFWNEKVQTALHEHKYSVVIEIYESLINSNPSKISYYCYLGLAYLLNHQEDLAQLTWLSLTSNNQSEKEIISLLTNILDNEATRQSTLKNRELSWVIRQHVKNIDPNNLNNLLKSIIDSILIDQFNPQDNSDLELINLLLRNKCEINYNLIESVANNISGYTGSIILELLFLLSEQIDDLDLRWSFLMKSASNTGKHNLDFAIKVSELCLSFYREHPKTWIAISYFNSKANKNDESVKAAEKGFLKSKSAGWKAVSVYTLIRQLMLSGNWIELQEYIESYKISLKDLCDHGLSPEDNGAIEALITTPCLLQYYQDNPSENRLIQNKIAELYQEKINALSLFKSEEKKFESDPNIKLEGFNKLRIGFIAHTLKSHSVGWLFRWICKYIDLDKFEVTLFLISQNKEDFFVKSWFSSEKFNTLFLEENYLEIVKSIKFKNIQILVDLDSLTLQETCKVLACKPAPVQITWLGFDATGIPSVDYYFADPFVLPCDAQTYYQEKIYRLPHTYIAVDGFEVATPTISKEDLEIPTNSVVFFTAQTGFKRNPDFIRQQLKIIREVPHSYLLVKGAGNSQKIKDLFNSLALETGISKRQLRFLNLDNNEFNHRANLTIADVVLDTYPYNGATTTLEALWVGLPVVTRVGQQFSSRNGYAFLNQVDITEGIATTDDEYVQWGIRFGTDENLRQRIYCKLLASHQYSPLWNAKKFTNDLEYAFVDIWEKHLASINI